MTGDTITLTIGVLLVALTLPIGMLILARVDAGIERQHPGSAEPPKPAVIEGVSEAESQADIPTPRAAAADQAAAKRATPTG
jgi:hypothetical protein